MHCEGGAKLGHCARVVGPREWRLGVGASFATALFQAVAVTVLLQDCGAPEGDRVATGVLFCKPDTEWFFLVEPLPLIRIGGSRASSPWCNGPDFGMAVGVV